MKYWVLDNEKTCKAKCSINGNQVTLENGLVRRVIYSNLGTTSYFNLMTDEELIDNDSVDYELIVNGMQVDLYTNPCNIHIIDNIVDVPYNGSSTATENMEYPAKGVSVALSYNLDDIKIEIIYMLYDNLPVICKRIRIINDTDSSVTIDKVVVDRLAIFKDKCEHIYMETDFNGGCMLNNNRLLSAGYDGQALCAYFEPHTAIKSGETFESLRAYELLHVAKFYEQRMIEVKQAYRKLFPWVLDNPLIFHVTSDSAKKVKYAISQASNVGFDGIIQSFGSKINLEDCSKRNIEKHKKLYDYAHSQGLKIGGYTLAIVKNYKRVRGAERNDRAGSGGIFRCLATEWSEKYWQKIYNFYERTGADLIEIDGPYHFYECDGGDTHLHKGVEDSRYTQWKLSNKAVYQRLKELGVYINTPDWHYLNGVNKVAIGYEEIAFSQPRQEQLLAHRIYNYKGTFNKIPSMAWGFLPIDEYHGGGKSAKFSPLEKNIFDYEWAVFQSVMSGVIPCFRGRQLFDGEKSRAMLAKWVTFYKKYKNVLNGITVHFMPPRMSDNSSRATDIDCILNCTTSGEVRGILAVFNQTDKHQKKIIKVPVFYTGLCDVNVIPPTYVGSGITKVPNPVYGEYPPPYPVENAQNTWTPDLVTGTGTAQVLVEQEVLSPPAVDGIGQITIANAQGVKISINYDSNADIKLEIDLPPMSYTHYFIYEK